MKTKPISQSLVLAGESAEEDERFERALRLNSEGVSRHRDMPQSARPVTRTCARRRQELYRMVTQGESILEVGTIDLNHR
jgi:hypothetical protein